MRKLHLYLLILLLCTAQAIFCQNKIVQSVTERVRDIRKHRDDYIVQQPIKTDTSYRVIYLKGKELQQISVSGIDNHLQKNVSWYFYQGQLIFIEQQWLVEDRDEFVCGRMGIKFSPVNSYNDSIAPIKSQAQITPPKRNFTMETDHELFYFQHGELAVWIKNGVTMNADSEEFKRAALQLSAYGQELVNRYK